MRQLYHFLRLIGRQRELIFEMAKRELATVHVGSVLGFVWTFIHPMVIVLVFWVVFGLIFRPAPGEYPFVVWLTTGMAAWFAFSDIVGGATGVITDNANLIKRTRFHAHILPVVKIASALVTHAVFLGLLILLLAFHGLAPSALSPQFLYYLFCLCTLGLGLGWFFSAMNPFVRDTRQIVAVLLQIGMWATPIMYRVEQAPEWLHGMFAVNPMHYIVQGYRDSFLDGTPFWHRPVEFITFWAVAGSLFVVGALTFKRLRPHFADVL